MLDARRSAWLPLQPLSSSTPAPSTLPGGTGDRSLPGGSCSIEALRDTFTPLYYSPACQLSPREVPIISHASTRDLAALLKLHSTTLPLKYDPAFFISLLLNANYIVLVAKLKDNTVVACTTASLDPYLHELELLTLCVDHRYGRSGLATSLLHEVATRALECSRQSTLTAILRVQTTNTPALTLYSKLGFLTDAIEPTYYKGALRGPTAAFRMKKVITSE